MNRFSGIAACLTALTAVALGAFGAHALKPALLERGTLDAWKTAVNYQMWHALALLFCALVNARSRALITAQTLFMFGIVLFSGSLYWLALGGPNSLGPITPLGGLSLIGGWCALAVAFWKQK